MSDLKNLYDRVLNAQADVEKVKNQINEALALGTPEGDDQALALEATLDEATAEATKWLALYDKVSKPQKGADLTKFVPVSETPTEPDGEKSKGTIKRSEFQSLKPRDRMKFVKGGGMIED